MKSISRATAESFQETGRHFLKDRRPHVRRGRACTPGRSAERLDFEGTAACADDADALSLAHDVRAAHARTPKLAVNQHEAFGV
jgi:hypothetical protein